MASDKPKRLRPLKKIPPRSALVRKVERLKLVELEDFVDRLKTSGQEGHDAAYDLATKLADDTFWWALRAAYIEARVGLHMDHDKAVKYANAMHAKVRKLFGMNITPTTRF